MDKGLNDIAALSKPYFVRLPGRGLIHLEGDDRHTFLQGLVTNDVNLLKTKKIVYACLLTAQGKFLHDFLMQEGSGFTLLDCEGGTRAQDLFRRLQMFRLRANVQISVEDNIPVYAIMNGADSGTHPAFPDPRHPALGLRSFEPLPDLPERGFNEWDRQRISLCIPDGSRDMEIEATTLAEARLDKDFAVSFTKGCYVGQELTARMHHRGLAKKHLYTVKTDDPTPAPGSEIHINGASAGYMRSSCGDLGLALLKDEIVPQMAAGPVKVMPPAVLPSSYKEGTAE